MQKNSIQATNRQISVPFHGANLLLIEHDGQPYTPMKPVVGGIGLDWASQYRKVAANHARWGVVELTIPSAGGAQGMTCLPIRKLAAWLATIEPGKVKDLSIRARVIQYQNECDDVLWQYWTEGVAINERIAFSVNADDVLTGDQQETLRLMVKALAERLPKNMQGAATIKAWSKLKAHFKVPYRKIPRAEFTEAVSIVTRTAAEWEVLDAEPKCDEWIRESAIAVLVQMMWLRSWWRQIEPALRHLAPSLAYSVNDNFVEGSVHARSLARHLGYQIQQEYIDNYPFLGSLAEQAVYRAAKGGSAYLN